MDNQQLYAQTQPCKYFILKTLVNVQKSFSILTHILFFILWTSLFLKIFLKIYEIKPIKTTNRKNVIQDINLSNFIKI